MSDYPQRPAYGFPFEQSDASQYNGYPGQAQQNGYPNEIPNMPYGQGPAAFAQAFAAFQQNSMDGLWQNSNMTAYGSNHVGESVPGATSMHHPLAWNPQGVPAASFFQTSSSSQPASFQGAHGSHASGKAPSVPGSTRLSGMQNNSQHREELSEGEFDEPFDGQPAQPIVRQNKHGRKHHGKGNRAQQGPRPAVARHAQGVTAAPLTDMYGRTVDTNRQKSPSYSPRISPVQQAQSVSKVSKAQASRKQQNMRPRHKLPEPPVELQYDDSAPLVEHSQAVKENTLKALMHARKEAQNAILNLLPHKVQLDDYVNEGIDKNIVRSQFEELRIPLTLPSVGKNSTIDQNHTAEDRDIVSPHKATDTSTLKSSVTFAPTSGRDGSGEERKDRIARLLAEKAKKNTTSSTASTVVSAKPVTAVTAVVKAEKERLLKQKMEALQKSREARARKPSLAQLDASVPGKDAEVQSPVAESGKPESLLPSISQSSPEGAAPLTATEHDLQTLSTASTQASMAKGPNEFIAVSPASYVSPSSAIPLIIPGLFLSSNPANSSNLGNAPISNHRKRPVASDFDSQSSSDTSYKRPFGQSRQDSKLVIDVSDEDYDDADAEVDVDDDNDDDDNVDHLAPDQPRGNSRNDISERNNLPLREHALLSEFSPRMAKTPSNPNLSAPSTPLTNSRASTTKPVDFESHAQELLALKKKLALMELRKAKKNLPQNVSQSVTSANAEIAYTPPAIAAKNRTQADAAAQIDQLIDAANQQINNDQTSLENIKTIKLENVQGVISSEVEEKRLRALRLEEDLPAIEAELEQRRSRLAGLRAEMAKVQASLEEGLRSKVRLAQEMEQLQKDNTRSPKTSELTVEEVAYNAIPRTPPHEASIVVEQKSDRGRMVNLPVTQSDPVIQQDVDVSANGLPRSSSPGKSVEDSKVVEPLPALIMDSTTSTQPTDIEIGRSLDAALQESIANEVDTTREANVIYEVSKDVDMGDASAPNPGVLAPLSPGDAPDYMAEDMVLDDGSSDYEMIEASPAVDLGEEPMVLDSPSESSTSAPSEQGEAEISSNRENVPESIILPEEGSVSVAISGATLVTQEPASETPVLEGQISSGTNGDMMSPAPIVDETEAQSLETRNAFTAYHSPLSRFHQYRFHRGFEDNVTGGFKSLTYSNKIKPGDEVCPYELAGGICNDAQCNFQHFKDMGLPDDIILVQLGNSDGYSDAQRPKFVTGLRTVLTNLRKQRVKDFGRIASEIAAFRREFLEDESRVLLLGDITI